MWHVTPLVAGLHDVTNTIEQLPQAALTAATVLPAQQQIRQHKLPLLVTHVPQIRSPVNLAHLHSMENNLRHVKSLLRSKDITDSREPLKNSRVRVVIG